MLIKRFPPKTEPFFKKKKTPSPCGKAILRYSQQHHVPRMTEGPVLSVPTTLTNSSAAEKQRILLAQKHYIIPLISSRCHLDTVREHFSSTRFSSDWHNFQPFVSNFPRLLLRLSILFLSKYYAAWLRFLFVGILFPKDLRNLLNGLQLVAFSAMASVYNRQGACSSLCSSEIWKTEAGHNNKPYTWTR